VKPSRSGITLVELMISGAILALAVYFFGVMFAGTTKSMQSSYDKAQTASDVLTLSGSLQKNMASGDVRFFGFSGGYTTAAVSDRDQLLARYLVPQPGYCVDGTSDATRCNDSQAFHYIHYDKTTAPAVTAICEIGSLYPDGNEMIWVVDTANPSYGTSQGLVAGGFEVLAPSPTPGQGLPFPVGPIEIATNTVLALFNPPVATLWVAKGAPTAFNPLTAATAPAGSLEKKFWDTCSANIQTDIAHGAAFYENKSDVLYLQRVRPLFMSMFKTVMATGVSQDVIRSGVGQYPMRFLKVQPRVIGLAKAVATDHVGLFEMRNCSITGSAPASKVDAFSATWALNCGATKILSIPATKVRVLHGFSLALSSEVCDLYDVKTAVMSSFPNCAGTTCTAGGCKALPMSDPAQVRGALDVGGGVLETVDTMVNTGFSFIK